jgi:hypothetical protein
MEVAAMLRVRDLYAAAVPDPDPDIAYLDEPWNKERLAALLDGQFWYVGVFLRAEIERDGEHVGTVETPGVWGIESDCLPCIEEAALGLTDSMVDLLEDFGLEPEPVEWAIASWKYRLKTGQGGIVWHEG